MKRKLKKRKLLDSNFGIIEYIDKNGDYQGQEFYYDNYNSHIAISSFKTNRVQGINIEIYKN